MKEPQAAPVELVGEMRDYALELYLRRLPDAAPEPGTSLYAIIEASAMVWASVVFNSENPEVILDGLRKLVGEDREEPVSPPPNEDPEFYKPKDKKARELLEASQEEIAAHTRRSSGTAPDTGCVL